MVALFISAGFTLLLCALLYWLLGRWRCKPKQASPEPAPGCERRSSGFEQLRQELEALLPALYQSEPSAQRAVGIGLNMATALFRSVYPSDHAFELVSMREQQDFIRRLSEAERRFHETDKAEAGIAVTLFKCWLSSIVERDQQTAAELKRHLDYFSCQPLEVGAEVMNRTTGSGQP